MLKKNLEDKLSNGEVCGSCPCLMECECDDDCEALRILKELTGYPSFEHSQINCVDNSRSDSK